MIVSLCLDQTFITLPDKGQGHLMVKVSIVYMKKAADLWENEMNITSSEKVAQLDSSDGCNN